MVLSRDIGIRKPDPRIFRYALERIGVQPGNALHVGDSMKHDVVGARRAGMKTVWIRSEEEIREEPDYILCSIRELPGVLKRLKNRLG